MHRRHEGAGQCVGLFAEPRQPLGHRQNAGTRRRGHALGEAKAGNARDFRHGRGQFGVRILVQATFERGENRRAVMALHRQHEREPETLLIGVVERLQAREFRRAALVETGAGLFPARCGGEFATHGGAAGEIRVGAHQCELALAVGRVQRVAERVGEIEARCKGAPLRGLCSDPVSVFEDAVEGGDKAVGIERVQRVEINQCRHGLTGCCARQWRAMSMRRQIQTSAKPWT